MPALAALALLGVVPSSASAASDLSTGQVRSAIAGGARGAAIGAFRATLRVSERTSNRGDSFAPRSSTRYYLRRGGRSVLLGARSVEALAPGASSAGSRDLVIPDVTAGSYRVLACADGRRRFGEESERNNCGTSKRLLRIVDNALPAVFIGGGAMTGAIVEGGDPERILPELTVSDQDDPGLTGATVRIRGADAGDVLVYEREQEAELSGSYNSGTGVLTILGGTFQPDSLPAEEQPLARYQDALRSIRYRYAGDNPRGRRVLEVSVRDAKGAWSVAARRTLQVTPVNDPPRLSSTTSTRGYARGGGPQPVDPAISVFDPDSRIAGATVSIGSGFSAAEDELAFATRRGITGTYDSGTGVLTLLGTTFGGYYKEALRTVTYRNSSSAGPTTQRRIAFQVTDDEGAQSNSLFIIIEALP